MPIKSLSKPGTRKIHEAYFFTESEIDSQLRLREVTREDRGPYFAHEAQLPIDDYVLAYVKGGEGVAQFLGKEWKLEPGSLFVRNVREVFELRTTGDKILNLLRVSYVGDAAIGWHEKYLKDLSGVWRLNNADALFSIFQSLLDEGKNAGSHRDETCSLLLKMLFLKIAEGKKIGTQAEWRSHETFQKCRAYLDANYDRAGSSEEAADAAKVSHTHMCRLFKRFMSLSPHVYLLRLRMNQASQILLDSDKTLEQLALKYGYSDPFSFSKAFKRATGLAPQKFREMHSL